MPSRFSSDHSIEDAQQLAENLGIDLSVIPIEPIHRAFEQALAPQFKDRVPDVTEENIQARIRGNLLMGLSNKFGRLLLTTGNKSELAVGYCTLYGDMCGGVAVLSDVPKTIVYELARRINAEPRTQTVADPCLVTPSRQTGKTVPPSRGDHRGANYSGARHDLTTTTVRNDSNTVPPSRGDHRGVLTPGGQGQAGSTNPHPTLSLSKGEGLPERSLIPLRTIEKPPSAELRENQRDQDTLPPYDILDAVLERYVERRMSPDDIVAEGFDRVIVESIARKVDANEYKRKQAPVGLKVTSVAFGTGRRMPIAAKFQP
jgi:NH3-dependent NAD+ synthetase